MSRFGTKFFDVGRIKRGSSIMILGPRHSGKSVLQRYLLSRMRGWYDFGLALTPTLSSAEEFKKIMPAAFVRRQTPEQVSEMIEFMTKLNKARGKHGRDPKHAFLVCDDTAYDAKFMKSTGMLEMAQNGRHANITPIQTLQYLKNIPPAGRGNMDFIFVRYEGDLDVRKQIRKSWFSMLSPKEFDEVFDEATQNYGVLVRDSRAASNTRDWRECYFRFRAPAPEDIPPFQLCKKSYTVLSKFCTTGDDEDEYEEEPPQPDEEELYDDFDELPPE